MRKMRHCINLKKKEDMDNYSKNETKSLHLSFEDSVVFYTYCAHMHGS